MHIAHTHTYTLWDKWKRKKKSNLNMQRFAWINKKRKFWLRVHRISKIDKIVLTKTFFSNRSKWFVNGRIAHMCGVCVFMSLNCLYKNRRKNKHVKWNPNKVASRTKMKTNKHAHTHTPRLHKPGVTRKTIEHEGHIATKSVVVVIFTVL